MDKEKLTEDFEKLAPEQEDLINNARVRETQRVISNMDEEDKRIAATVIMRENPEIIMDVVANTFKDLMEFKSNIAKTCVNFYEGRKNWV